MKYYLISLSFECIHPIYNEIKVNIIVKIERRKGNTRIKLRNMQMLVTSSILQTETLFAYIVFAKPNL